MTPARTVRVIRTVALATGVLAAIRLIGLALDPEDRVYLGAGLALSAVLIGGVMLGVAHRVRTLARRVERLRPGAVVIPAYTTVETSLDAIASGGSNRRWNQMGGTPVVLAALPDRVEVWALREERPRWAVMRRAQFPPVAVRGVVGVRRPPALHLTDGSSRVTVVPAYSAVRATMSGSQADLARAMSALGAPVTGF
jgi:hypothetical protein